MIVCLRVVAIDGRNGRHVAGGSKSKVGCTTQLNVGMGLGAVSRGLERWDRCWVKDL